MVDRKKIESCHHFISLSLYSNIIRIRIYQPFVTE